MIGCGQWPIRYLPLSPLSPVPSDIEVARNQTPKHVRDVASEVGLLASEVRLIIGPGNYAGI